ncbi:hypothetical protein [Nonomuraea candida]|uniref:hypothetical protein n=1 Tax=Nonomuraea candida TaxID=359159 RepID=UPI0005BAC433|nr:hypothetical protein [Nonomuraea candida]
MSRGPVFAGSGSEIDDDTGREMAARLEEEYGHMALVLWEVAGRHLTAFWRGHVPEAIYVKGRTPQELRAALAARLAEVTRPPHIPGGSFPIPRQGRGPG